jgi:predicted dinucleotide-binding enzyme
MENIGMRVAIIGSGRVGSALGLALSRAGHEVRFGARKPDPGKPAESGIAEAVASADATILAVPFAAADEIVAAAGGFVGKVLIDATNPVGMRDGELGLLMGFNTSGAEHIAASAPQAHVFKAFNQTGFENMTEAHAYPARPMMFVAGDHEAEKPLVLRLVADAGFEAIDAGKLRAARLLEPLALLWIELGRKGGHGADFTFAMQRKAAGA